ncbi:MAG: HAMP domain-containing sensor histidine kinase [Pseudoxanthomonas sp.]
MASGPEALPHGLRAALVARAALASVAVLAGALLVVFLVRQHLVAAMLQSESAYFWTLYATSPAHAPPNTEELRGYLVPAGQSVLQLPEELRPLSLGLSRVGGRPVLVSERPLGRLYLMWMGKRAVQLSTWGAALLALLGLLTLYSAFWLTWRIFGPLLSPVSWLAQEVATWDPHAPDGAALSPERLPRQVQGESRQLAIALYDLSRRVTAQIERERAFTRDASHELRTPLTVIRVASDMALANELPPRAVRSLQRIQRSSREMEAVIDAFLILAREREVEPQAEDFDMAELLQEEAHSARDLLVGKPVDLEVAIRARPRLHAPPRVMHVVVGNLLRNACGFIDAGRIEVILDSDRLTVCDTGIGMTAEAMVRALEPFYRADETHRNGTGLGLTIVNRLCQRFGWKLELDSVLGQGTTVVVRFS